MFQETSESKEDSAPNLAEMFQTEDHVIEEIEIPEEFDEAHHQVSEELVAQQFGTHFLAVQGDDGFAEPVAKKQKFSSPVVMRTSSVVKCDKCQRNIKSEEFRSHYRDVHLESTSTDAAKNQVLVAKVLSVQKLISAVGYVN